jgi:chemotaxis response regulator CheB
MPREAIRQGAAQHVVPLHQIGPRLDQLISHPSAMTGTGVDASQPL